MFSWLRPRVVAAPAPSNRIQVTFAEGGPEYRPVSPRSPALASAWLRTPENFANWDLVTLLGQLESEGLAVAVDDAAILGWEDLYRIIDQPDDYRGARKLLGIPPASSLTPHLSAKGAVSDHNFTIALEWLPSKHAIESVPVRRVGAVVHTAAGEALLSAASWRLAEAVREFARRTDAERNQKCQERAWGNIRKLARAVGARLVPYLEKTIVVTAATLNLSLRRTEISGTPVIEVQPGINGVSDGLWLKKFDGLQDVQDHYDLIERDTRIRVIIEPEAAAVLSEIKAMPGRRIAGQRAERFLRNPYAMLGEIMHQVVPPEQFEAARDKSGIRFFDFDVTPARDRDGRLLSVRLTPTHSIVTLPSLPSVDLIGKASLTQFTTVIADSINAQEPCFRFGNQVFELRGDAEDRLERLKGLLCQPWEGEPLVTYDTIHDLSGYGPRVTGIGAHNPQSVPFIGREDVDVPWRPDHLESTMVFPLPGGEETVTKGAETAIRAWIAGNPAPDAEFTPPGFSCPIRRDDAQGILDAFPVSAPQPPGTPDSPESPAPFASPKKARPALAIWQNVQGIEYAEERARWLQFPNSARPDIPHCMKASVGLLPHQERGVAWLQHLWSLRTEVGVRGALLADDMGLGKTLQLLAFIARYLEARDANDQDPVLIVAPVSLLENWRAELAKFFEPFLAEGLLLLYGSDLERWKIKQKDIDPQLVAEGIRTYLRHGWVDGRRIVLTTYETLRDLEFAFSSVRWSVMVCDEAQKIKTPGALVTHAVKAQKARFKVACTGTPVENSLADLWCLFDFFQPGLLGSLSEFCATYRKPIEMQTDQQGVQLSELRKLVEPQVLRRMKAEVAELKPKSTDNDCRRLMLSAYQRGLYGVVAASGRPAEGGADSEAALLGLLHRLRSICADPREPGTEPNLRQTINAHRSQSPKLDWLISTLENIRSRSEKVIVFTEFRDLQRMLQRRIQQHFGFSPAIVNGSTKVGSEVGEQSRQALINVFQEKTGFGVIILSTTAVGFGVNIQAANHVIHFTRSWNPAKEDQATDRAYRIGQEKEVTVYYPTVIAEDFVTFEAKLDALLESKRRIADDMLNGASNIDPSDWGDLSDSSGVPLVSRARLTVESLERLQPKVFERLCEVYFKHLGYTTYRTPTSNDGGVDVVAVIEKRGYLVQCKSSTKSGKALGWEAVGEVVGGTVAYQRKHPDVTFRLMAATNQTFNENARKQAVLNEVELLDCSDWEAWLKSNAIYLEDLV